MGKLDEYYNKFNEDKRLTRRHGIVEYQTSMKYIHDYIPEGSRLKIIDIGAGTGRYSIPLSKEGHEVTAVEPAAPNLGKLKAKKSDVRAFRGSAVDLKKFPDNTYDLTILFGPMYHLISHEDKLKALKEAGRVTKPDGVIFVAYCMNEYSVLTYGFKEHHLLECMDSGRISPNFLCTPEKDELYDYVRMEEIDRLNREAGLVRLKIISADGPANYMRTMLNHLSEEEFNLFLQYHLATCERPELVGAGAHTVDILRKEDSLSISG